MVARFYTLRDATLIQATCTDRIQHDIISDLRLKKPKVLSASFNRPNIRYQVGQVAVLFVDFLLEVNTSAVHVLFFLNFAGVRGHSDSVRMHGALGVQHQRLPVDPE